MPSRDALLFPLSVDEGCTLRLAYEDQQELAAQLELLEESLAPCLQPRGPFSAKLFRDVMLFHDRLLAEEGEVDGVVLASKLTALGYRVAVRQALGGGVGTAVFSQLRHSFLLVTAQDCPCAGIDFIVEPHFREQFEISHPTARYSGLLSMLPPVFVGRAAQLTPLVDLLCSEMSLAFEQHGLSLPPWRQSKSLLSKWLPAKLRDYDLSPHASPRAGSPDPLFPLAAITNTAVSAFAQVQQQGQQQRAQHGQQLYDCGPLQPISEAASGSITPVTFSGDDASPRAVLHGASAALLSQQHAQWPQQGERQREPSCELSPAPSSRALPGPPQLVRKSLLSSSLAASGQRSASPEARRTSTGALAGGGGGAAPVARAPSVGLPLVGVPPVDVLHLGGPAGLTYRVSGEWQQPAIRTVKMQGQAARAK